MVKFCGKFSVVLASLLLFLSVVFSPIVSYSTPEIRTVSSPSRVWLMSPEDDERCRQDTERYNAAWTAAWYASHPGQGPAPTPSPPYVCPPPPPDTPTTPTNPTPVSPNKPIVPGTNQGTGLPNELDNKPGNTPELNTGLGKPGEYKPGYDPATGLPVNGAEQANPNTGDPNNPQTGELAKWAAANNTSPPQVNNGKPIVPANVGPDAPKPPAPRKPEIVPDKPVDNGSLAPAKQPAEKIAPKPSKSGSLDEVSKHLPCIATWGLPTLGGYFGTGQPGINGAETGDLGYLIQLGNQMYAVLGDTDKLHPGPPNAYGPIPGQKYRGANILVPLTPDGALDVKRWQQMQGKLVPLPKHPGTVLRKQGQPSFTDKALRNIAKGANRLLPGGVIDTGNPNSALVMVTPVRGLNPVSGRGALYEVHIGRNGMPVWTPYNVDLPHGVSQISGAQVKHGPDKGTTYFATNNLDRKHGITIWRTKNIRDKNTWQWQDRSGGWHSYAKDPNFGLTLPERKTGEIDMKQLADGSWVLTYLDNGQNKKLTMRQAKTPGGLKNAPAKNITPPGAKSVYDANIMHPRQSLPSNLQMIFSRWDNLNYNINRMRVTGDCQH